MLKNIFYFFLLIIVLAYCKAKTITVEGTYSGTLPCADCEGIKYVLTLKENMTYSEKIMYLGKSKSIEKNSGTYVIKNDSVVWLKDKMNGKGMNQFAIENKKLVMLNLTGQRIKSSFSNKYILSKS